MPGMDLPLPERMRLLTEELEAILEEHRAGRTVPRALQMELFEAAEALLEAVHQPSAEAAGAMGMKTDP